MARRPLSSLGLIVREKRGSQKLREVAQDIGIGAATLMRVENGRIPDLKTFGKLCKWLAVDPGDFLGFERATTEEPKEDEVTKTMQVSAHLRADQTPKKETVHALANMILLAVKKQPTRDSTPEYGNT